VVKIRDLWKLVIGLSILCLVMGVVFWRGYYNEYEESQYYDLYYVDAPFGVLWVDVEGRFIFASGTLDSELQETYIVKYFINGELHSTTFLANKITVVADGTFRLEKVIPYYDMEKLWGMQKHIKDPSRKIWWRIHIPSFPEVK